MRSPVTYFGGKTLLAPWITSQFPRHQHYVEPYAGSLAVLLAKEPSAHETVNDLDEDLVTFWRVLRERPEDLGMACALTPHSRVEQAAANVREQPRELDELERARRVWVQLTQGRGGVRTNTGWRYYSKPVGGTSMPKYLRGYVERMEPALSRLQSVSLECRDALEVVADYGRHANVLLYVDPPYLGSARSSGGYRHEMKTDEQHRALAQALQECRSTVILSGYNSPLYEALYSGWHQTARPTNTGQRGSDSHRTEVLWANRPLEGFTLRRAS